ncbi:MAG: potassium channel family protein [Patescibacteria group bacterium]|nr:potassium channel family protein [Patescibacteria group bacterium]
MTEEKTSPKDKLAKSGSVALIVVLSWIIIGTLLFHEIENWTYAQSFYYSVTTLTTVGYGDLTVTTDFNRIIAALYMLLGVTTTLGAFGYLGSSYIARKELQVKNRTEKHFNSKK